MLAIPLIPLLLCLIALALSYMTLALAKAISAAFSNDLPVIGSLVDWVTSKAVHMAEYMTRAIEGFFTSSVNWVTSWFTHTSKVSDWQGFLAFRTAISLNRSVRWITAVWFPTAIKPFAKPATDTARAARVQSQAATKAAAVTIPYPVARDLPAMDWLRKNRRALGALLGAAGAISLPFPGSISRPVPIPKPWQRWRSDTDKRTHRLEKTLGALGVLGLSAVELSRIGRFLRCPNTKGIAKTWCNTDLNALEGLLLDLAPLALGLTIEEIGKDSQIFTDAVAKGISLVFSDAPAAFANIADSALKDAEDLIGVLI